MKNALKNVCLIALLIIVLDQATKLLIIRYIAPGELVEVIPGFFNLTLTFNKGAAFGLFSGWEDDARHIVLTSAAIVAFITLSIYLLKDYLHDRVGHLAIGLIFGGAMGNIIDRIRFGQVTDFLDFYISDYHWPAFNVADSAICVGVAILIFSRPKHKQNCTESVHDSSSPLK